jgi:hypothetical protein
VKRGAVVVELQRFSATVRGPRLRPLLDRAGCRWHWHPNTYKAVSVHIGDVDDFLAVAELDRCEVVLIGRDGRTVPVGGLLGGVL